MKKNITVALGLFVLLGLFISPLTADARIIRTRNIEPIKPLNRVMVTYRNNFYRTIGQLTLNQAGGVAIKNLRSGAVVAEVPDEAIEKLKDNPLVLRVEPDVRISLVSRDKQEYRSLRTRRSRDRDYPNRRRKTRDPEPTPEPPTEEPGPQPEPQPEPEPEPTGETPEDPIPMPEPQPEPEPPAEEEPGPSEEQTQGENEALPTINDNKTWNIDMIGAPFAWNFARGNGVKVAIIDTGVDLDHDELKNNIIANHNTVKPYKTGDDDSGHGTHIAGVIAAEANGRDIVGIAPEVGILAVKALDYRGNGWLSDIIEAIDWSVEQGANVINLSLGSSTDLDSLREAILRAHNAGVAVVSSAGNTNGDVLYPAAYSEVIAVGAVDDDEDVPRWSARGPEIFLVAPGEDIYSTYKGNGFRKMDGTSMASPHVAGAIALMLSKPDVCDTNNNGVCSLAEITNTLKNNAKDVESSGFDTKSGWGLLDIAKIFGN